LSAMDHWLLRAAARDPQRAALGRLSYWELERAARRAAGQLRARGVAPGDRVALALPPGPEFVAALHGCFLAGAVAVPVDLRLTGVERERRLAGARILVEAALEGPPVEDPMPLELDAIATIMHTSGTTSAPKPVALSFGNWLASALGSAVALGLAQGERWLCPLPLVHVGGLSIPIRSAIYGTTAIVPERFEVEAVLAGLSDPAQRITLVSLVPTMLARLLEAGLREPPTLRWALLGGGPIPRTLLDRAAQGGVPVAPTYGMTEACSQITTHGWPLPGVEVQVASDGELLVQGDTVASNALAADGWLHTGDVGALDAQGRLTLTGRKADTIVTGGENVAPVEVEATLLEHPAVADAAVFGRADVEWGEAVVAKVVLRNGAAVPGPELMRHCAERLAQFKVPKRIEFAERLPRTETGKLMRQQLR
jgi:O-succinylbenzoic acid--CoA ligase